MKCYFKFFFNIAKLFIFYYNNFKKYIIEWTFKSYFHL